MRLSDAIAMGRTLACPFKGGSSRHDAKPGDGCVLDMAVLAVRGEGDWHEAWRIWPWLNTMCLASAPNQWEDAESDYFWEIIRHFDRDVMAQRTMTLDQLIDWVRSVEPAELELQQEAIAEQCAPAPAPR